MDHGTTISGERLFFNGLLERDGRPYAWRASPFGARPNAVFRANSSLRPGLQFDSF